MGVMGGNRKRGLRLGVLCALALACTGCKNQDVERLAKLGSTIAKKASTLVSGSNQRWSKSVRLHWGQVAVDARVAARLSWDKGLEDVPVEVEAEGTTVKLKGKVPDAAKRRRIVELASSTTGVEKVTDEMEGE